MLPWLFPPADSISRPVMMAKARQNRFATATRSVDSVHSLHRSGSSLDLIRESRPPRTRLVDKWRYHVGCWTGFTASFHLDTSNNPVCHVKVEAPPTAPPSSISAAKDPNDLQSVATNSLTEAVLLLRFTRPQSRALVHPVFGG